jgi:hypothetical protein
VNSSDPPTSNHWPETPRERADRLASRPTDRCFWHPAQGHEVAVGDRNRSWCAAYGHHTQSTIFQPWPPDDLAAGGSR